MAIDALAEGTEAIVVGPWLGEVGFELLYWIPFLTWAVERHPSLAERFHIISRGGAAPWYANISRRYVDVFELASPEEVRTRRGKRSKQVGVTAFEQELLKGATERLGLDAAVWLHPEVMYRCLIGLAQSQATTAFRRIAAHRRLAPPSSTGGQDDHTAVRFYASAPFPNEPANREFAAELVRRLAKRGDVVLLDTGLALDDHHDLPSAAGPGVTTIAGRFTPANNLAIQTEVIAGARAFVGTYGGLSYLPPLYGVPSFTFYSRAEHFLHRHLEYAAGAYAELDAAPYVVLAAGHLQTLELLAP